MNEAETRAEYIDPKLKASGWGKGGRGEAPRESLRDPYQLRQQF